MTRLHIAFLLLATLVAAQYSGYLQGYVVDYVDEKGTMVRSETKIFLRLDNGTLLEVDRAPWSLIGTGERVVAYGVVQAGILKVSSIESLSADITAPRRPVEGKLQVVLVAARWQDIASTPYNYTYIHDVVFGPAPSLRDYYETISGLKIRLMPYYIEPHWITLPISTAQFCSDSWRYHTMVEWILQYLYYHRNVTLPDYAYLIIILNAVPSCLSGVAGLGTIRHWWFNTPYGMRLIAVSWIFHYADWLIRIPDISVYVHEFGHNLGLHHPGTVANEYDDPWDPMGRGYRFSPWPRGLFLSPLGLGVYHKYYLGWAELFYLSRGGVLSSGLSGAVLNGGPPYVVVDYRCRVNPYDEYLPFCGAVFYRVNDRDLGRWVYFVNFTSNTQDSFLDVGEIVNIGRVAGIGDLEAALIWRNTARAYIVVGRPSLRDILLFSNASFVVGERASSAVTLSSAVLSGRLTPVLYLQQNGRLVRTYSAFLDSEFLNGNVPIQRRLSRNVILPSVIISVGGPFANRLTNLLNPPDRLGVDGLPFYYDTSVGGIRDAQTGRVWTRDAAVAATVVYQNRVYLVVWGLTSRDTYRASMWLRDCAPTSLDVRGIVINTTSGEIVASWPPNKTSYICHPKSYSEVVVIGERASQLSIAGAAIIGAGNAALDTWNFTGTYIFSVGGPFVNSFTRRYNPPNQIGYGGLPFYFDTAAGGIRDARTGTLYTGNLGVIASLNDAGKRIILAWGISGADTRAMASIVAHNKETLKRIRGNAAVLLSWSVIDGELRYEVLAAWCDCSLEN